MDVLHEVVGSLGRGLPFFSPLVLQNAVAGLFNVFWAGLEQSLRAIQSWSQVFYHLFSSAES